MIIWNQIFKPVKINLPWSKKFILGGQALAEIIFAVAMAVMLLSGMVVAMRAGLSNSQFSQHKTQSVYLAQEGVELTRQYADKFGWNQITEDNLRGYEGIENDAITIDGLNYARDIYLLSNDNANAGGLDDDNVKRISVEVIWNEFGREVNTTMTVVITK